MARYKGKKKTDKGNTVYLYSDRQVALRNSKKAERLKKLTRKMTDLRKSYRKDLTSDDEKTRNTALVVALIDETYERVGNQTSAKDGHYGVTGWQKNHISLGGGKATISYVGKSGVKQSKTVSDPKVVSALRKAWEAAEGKEGQIFPSVSAEDVNAYLPEGITAKDIRGLHANRVMREQLSAATPKNLPEDRKEKKEALKEAFKKALEATAKAVGHEPATLKGQYLVPGLEDSYLKDGTVEGPHKLAKVVVSNYLASLKPGSFTYMGGYVFEVDDDGELRKREDLTPDYKGGFTNKYFTGKKAATYAIDQAFVEKLRKDFLSLTKSVERIKTDRDEEKVRKAFQTWKVYFNKVIFEDWLNKKELWKSAFAEDVRKPAWNLYLELSLPQSVDARKDWLKKIKRSAQTLWRVMKNVVKGLKEIREREEEYLQRNPSNVQVSLTPGTMYGESVSEQRMELEGFKVMVKGLDQTSDDSDSFQSDKEELFSLFQDTLRNYKKNASRHLPLLLKAQVPMSLDYTMDISRGGDYALFRNNLIRINPWSGNENNTGSRVKILAHEMGHHVYQTILGGNAKELWETMVGAKHTKISIAEILQRWPENTTFLDDFSNSIARSDPLFALQALAAGGWDEKSPNLMWRRSDFVDALDSGVESVPVLAIPITAYAEKSPEEAFCEAIGLLVGYGPRAVHEKVRWVLSMMLPGQVKLASQVVDLYLRSRTD